MESEISQGTQSSLSVLLQTPVRFISGKKQALPTRPNVLFVGDETGVVTMQPFAPAL